ncbi:MAG: phage head spike fiber domain-containing protein [Candidatus Humimicrobiaceae bacterium]
MAITDGDTILAAHHWGSGTSFPGSPTNGQWFYRSDLNILYRYYNSAWNQVTPFSGLGNLLVNSMFKDTNEDTVPDWFALDGTPTLALAADTLCAWNDNHFMIQITADAANEGFKITGGTSNWLKVKPSTQYTFSVYYKATNGDNAGIKIKSYNGATGGTLHVNVANLNSTTAIRYQITLTTDSDATNLEIEFLAVANTDVVWFSHAMLEIGPSATTYIVSNKLKQISWGALAFNLDFTTAVPATLTEANGDADQVPSKSVAFTKLDCAWLNPEFDVPITYNGGSVLLSYRFYALAASKTHTMELAFVSRGLSDAQNGAVGGFTSLGADVADGTTSDEQINEILLTQAQIGFVAGEEIALYLRRENSGDVDEVYIKSLKIQYIEV